MSRLTLEEAIEHCKEKSDCTECGREHEQLAVWLVELQKYKNLKEHRRLIELPCAVGDTVWSIYKNEIYKSIATRIIKVDSVGEDFIRIETRFDIIDIFHNDGRTMPYDLFGIYLSDVFLTQEEAEAKLAEMEGVE